MKILIVTFTVNPTVTVFYHRISLMYVLLLSRFLQNYNSRRILKLDYIDFQHFVK